MRKGKTLKRQGRGREGFLFCCCHCQENVMISMVHTPQTIPHIGKKTSLGESRSRAPIQVIQSGKNKGMQQNRVLTNVMCPGLHQENSFFGWEVLEVLECAWPCLKVFQALQAALRRCKLGAWHSWAAWPTFSQATQKFQASSSDSKQQSAVKPYKAVSSCIKYLSIVKNIIKKISSVSSYLKSKQAVQKSITSIQKL